MQSTDSPPKEDLAISGTRRLILGFVLPNLVYGWWFYQTFVEGRYDLPALKDAQGHPSLLLFYLIMTTGELFCSLAVFVLPALLISFFVAVRSWRHSLAVLLAGFASVAVAAGFGLVVYAFLYPAFEY